MITWESESYLGDAVEGTVGKLQITVSKEMPDIRDLNLQMVKLLNFCTTLVGLHLLPKFLTKMELIL